MSSEIFIIGANGQLGSALRTLYPEAQSADINELDITDKASVDAFDWTNVEVIINAAAYTNVDGAETVEGRRTAWLVNATAVSYLADICIKHDITLVHVSSDYVFDGSVILHDEQENFAPLGVYAQTKAAGDIAVSLVPKHYIVRTSWVIGEGNNFVRTMRSLAMKDVEPSVVNDQIGRLTFTSDLALCIQHLLASSTDYGCYNFTNDGNPVSWKDIASVVFELSGYSPDRVSGVSTVEYYSGKEGVAPRPLQSTLNLAKIKSVGYLPRDWKVAINEYMKADK